MPLFKHNPAAESSKLISHSLPHSQPVDKALEQVHKIIFQSNKATQEVVDLHTPTMALSLNLPVPSQLCAGG